MLVNVDFHIHGKYSGGTSESMTLDKIAEQGGLKGLDIIGTGDALHKGWIKHIKELLVEENDGIYSLKFQALGKRHSKFIIQTEVEDLNRVHHVILFPSLEAAESLRETLLRYSKDIDEDGRPHISLTGEELVDLSKEVDAMLGPAHAFTPWTSLYKEFDSMKECYRDKTKDVKFIELGLSADTYMADRISELQDVTFMSNSDTHSPWPHRLGREFNRLELKDLSFKDIKKAILHKNGRKFVLNVGLNPKEGKYHLTACTRCHLKFKIKDAIALKFRCPECGGIIKKGVLDRIEEISTWKKPRHPWHRPKYVHIIPLAEVIGLAYNIKTINSKRIKNKWLKLVKTFGSEIEVLLDAEIAEIKKVDAKVADIISRFREERIKYVSGGGGKYGYPVLKNEKDVFWHPSQQKSLREFY